MPKNRQQLLAALFAQPQRAWYSAELAKHLGMQRSGVLRDLRALTKASILKSHTKGRMVFFQPDETSPVFKELQGLIMKTAGAVDVLRELLTPFKDKIIAAFVYGSIAAGTEKSHSDIDLMIVGSVQLIDLSSVLTEASSRLLRPVNPNIYTEEEFKKCIATDERNSFLRSVLAMPKLEILGSMRGLETTTRGRPSRKSTAK
jgi:predicted nucleotidyltransferase